MNVAIQSPCIIAGSIPCLQSGGGPLYLQIPQIYYNETCMLRIGTNPLDPRVQAVIPWATFIGSAWPFPINGE
jgi:hypothetical protein